MCDKIDGPYVSSSGSGLRGYSQVRELHRPYLRWIFEFIGYTVGALAGLAADASLLMLLVDGLELPVLPSAAFSFTAGALVVYVITVRIAFRRHKLRDRRIELVTFVGVGCAGLLVTLVVMAVGIQWLQMDYRLCKLVAAGGSFLFNYVARKALLF